MKLLQPSEQLAQLRLNQIQKRKRFWKDTWEVCYIILGAVVITGLVGLAVFTVNGGLSYMRDMDSIKERLSRLESRPPLVQHENWTTNVFIVVTNTTPNSVMFSIPMATNVLRSNLYFEGDLTR